MGCCRNERGPVAVGHLVSPRPAGASEQGTPGVMDGHRLDEATGGQRGRVGTFWLRIALI
ncbi:hypothetical protein XAP412_690003 [Xanthomonas phaseoli pv. phaseoli]|uniref:Uncharacterized protein n=1 Tax=Xanthomonas campestris pv. phaseoli TaxID=317013 RepID=A0AB38E3B0_XANCH|nr:hypothetical protein XAP6984_730003 [Xanthomonas phaseoli pv. phaseoli]SON88843.1 hypothetical protein XAP412_690003 [Xanthomonas phaseoli pv. phaseoli]SON92037.1 hypothetical protein XAP7430_690003 [Xanthomonas phaseoli pv. phaseoli]SOO28914.1 hypothetical protein XAP6164_2890022 [Xanthomonas phaseoli pv. phaseoli]